MNNNANFGNVDDEATQFGDFQFQPQRPSNDSEATEYTDYSGNSSEATEYTDYSGNLGNHGHSEEATEYTGYTGSNNSNNEETEIGDPSLNNPQNNNNSGNGDPIATSWMSEKGTTIFDNHANSIGSKISWKKVAQGGVTGIALGSAAVLLASWAGSDEDDWDNPEFEGELVLEVHPEPEGTGESTSSLAPLVDSDVAWAHSVNDSMSYSEAFAAARAEVGPGGVFEWRGQLYGTYYGEEWDNMSRAERDEFNNHFAWSDGSHPSVEDDIDIAVEPEPELADSHHSHTSPSTDHSHSSSPSDHSEDITVEPDSGDDITVEPDGPTDEIEVEPVDENEIEILGTYYDEETGFTYGGMTIDGEDVLLIDVESDNDFDYAFIDMNHNGEMDPGELIDLHEEETKDDLIVEEDTPVDSGDLYEDDFADDSFMDDDMV